MQKTKKFKLNPLSLIKGGYFITVEKMDGDISRGINVKSIKKYLETTIPNSFMDGNPVRKVYFTGGGEDIIYENGKFFF